MDDLCDVCGAAGSFEPWLEVSVGGIYERWVHRCHACGFRQVRPRLDRREITRLYRTEYFDATSPVGYGDYARQAQRRRREAFFIARRRRHRAGRHALEVGCALGFLLAALRDEGYEVAGVDASTFAAYYARTRLGLAVTSGTLETARYPEGAFDLVVQKDLLEHVANPRSHLQETWRVMRTGGELLLITPNGEANLRPLVTLAGDLSPEHLPLLDQGHLSFFSERHLRALFHDCGFVVDRARAVGVRRGLKALGQWPGQRRFARATRRGGTGTPDPRGEGETTEEVSALERLGAQVDQDIAACHRWIRGWRPYYYVHRFSKLVDSLPARTALGYDFEFWLRKR